MSELKAKISDPTLRVGFNDIFTPLADSVEFGAFARSKVNESRRAQILHGLLFGTDMESAMRTVEQTNKLSLRVTFNKL